MNLLPQEQCEVCTRPWKYYVKPFKIIDNLYYVGNKDVSSYLVDTGKGLILHDTTFPQTAYLLLESIRELGFNPKDIKYIIHSHGHYDHFGATKVLVELTSAKTFLGKDDIFILEDRHDLTWAAEYGVEFYEEFKVDHPLKDGDKIELGSICIECLNIPGHTPGAMSYFFNMKSGLKTYRVGTHGGPGLNTLSNEFLERYNVSKENRNKYLDSINKMKKEKVDIFLGIHPVLGDMLGKEKLLTESINPFIDRNQWPDLLDERERRVRKEFNL